jgi:site-specific recombinase XerC
LTIEDLKKYFETLKEKGNSPNTIRLHQLLFIQFFNFCLDESDNEKYSIILRKLKRLKVDKVKSDLNPADILFPEDIKKLINTANLERDRCIVASYFESGMRMSEGLALGVDMVEMNEARQEVTFHIPNTEGCKTGARSIVCLEIYGYVQDWLKCNPSKRFIPLHPSGLRKIILNLFKKAGIKKPCNMHTFRHSAITHAAGLNMSETQLSYRFWGIPHSNMLSTYIHLNEQLKSSGYRDAKGLGEASNNSVINPLSVRCVQCGRLIQSGDMCPQCKENKELKARIATLERKGEEVLRLILEKQGTTLTDMKETVGDKSTTENNIHKNLIKHAIDKGFGELHLLKRKKES